MKAFLKLLLLKPLYNLLILLVFVAPTNSLAFAVIVLTVVIRVAMLPLTKSLTRQQALMTKLKPEIDALREKNKSDQPAQARELMAFYKKHHVNPAGSCLPMILQLVILLVLYYVFRIGITTDRFDLLYSFTPRPNQINPHFGWLDLSKPDMWILPIITGVLQFFQTWQMLPKKIDKSDPSQNIQRQMMLIFPVMTVVIARSFPAALPLYWSVSSIISIIQQSYILKQTAKITPTQADEILETGAEDVKVSQTKEVIKKKGVEITVRKKSA